MAGLLPRYDVVLIDCPPSLGLLTVNALTAARSVVVPIQCEFLALEGLGQLMTTVDRVKRGLNPPLDVTGVLMTMFDARTRLSAHVVEEVRRYFPHRMFGTVVPRSVRLAEAPSYGQAIVEYDPSSRGAEAYEAFVNELTTRLHLPPRRRPGRESAEGTHHDCHRATSVKFAVSGLDSAAPWDDTLAPIRCALPTRRNSSVSV